MTELDAAVAELAGVLASKPPGVMRLGRESFYAVWDSAASEALAHLHAMLTVTSQTAEAAEGIAAFAEKRAPCVAGTLPPTNPTEPEEPDQHGETSTDHRRHRPGRLLSGRVPARRGLRGLRHGPALEHGQLRADRPHPGPHRPWWPATCSTRSR